MLNLKLKGKVVIVSDEQKSFPQKDKDGNLLPSLPPVMHRVTNIVITEKSSGIQCLVKGFDLPSTFVVPAIGADWETPPLKGLSDRGFGLPEVNV